MTRERAICAVIAVLCHAALLFGFRVGSMPVPRPLADEAVEVSLVAGEPAPIPAEPEVPPSLPTPPPPQPSPPPPTPEALPEPPPKPEPTIEPEPKRDLPPPPHLREPPREQRPAPPMPHKPAPSMGSTVRAPAAAGNRGAPLSGPHGTSGAHPLSNPKPPYPGEARRLRQEGRVLLQVTVTAEGRASNVTVRRSSGVPALDESAVATVRRWTFEPARAAGMAIESKIDVPVVFSLTN